MIRQASERALARGMRTRAVPRRARPHARARRRSARADDLRGDPRGVRLRAVRRRRGGRGRIEPDPRRPPGRGAAGAAADPARRADLDRRAHPRSRPRHRRLALRRLAHRHDGRAREVSARLARSSSARARSRPRAAALRGFGVSTPSTRVRSPRWPTASSSARARSRSPRAAPRRSRLRRIAPRRARRRRRTRRDLELRHESGAELDLGLSPTGRCSANVVPWSLVVRCSGRRAPLRSHPRSKRPSPAPPCARVRALSARANRSKMRSSASGGTPHPRRRPRSRPRRRPPYARNAITSCGSVYFTAFSSRASSALRSASWSAPTTPATSTSSRRARRNLRPAEEHVLEEAVDLHVSRSRGIAAARPGQASAAARGSARSAPSSSRATCEFRGVRLVRAAARVAARDRHRRSQLVRRVLEEPPLALEQRGARRRDGLGLGARPPFSAAPARPSPSNMVEGRECDEHPRQLVPPNGWHEENDADHRGRGRRAATIWSSATRPEHGCRRRTRG